MFSTLPDRRRALSQLDGPGDALLLARMGIFAAAVPWLMRLPLPRLAPLVTRPARRRPAAHGQVARMERVIELAPTIAGPFVHRGCLTRGLTLFWFLRRAGVDVELRFGIDPTGGPDSDGHCWLTLGGEPFLEKADPRPRFAETYRLPVPAGA